MKTIITPFILLLFISCNNNKQENNAKKDNPYIAKAWVFREHDKLDSSFIYFNKAKEEYLKHNDNIGAAKSLINMAIIAGNQGDYFGSQEISLSAIKYLDPEDSVQREISSSNYSNLGKMAHNLKKYNEADTFYLKSIQFTNKRRSRNIYLNNFGINLSYQKKYTQALNCFEKVLTDDSIKKDSLTFARTLSNAAKTKWLINSDYNPVPEFIEALKIRIQKDDSWGQNASYSHLADYYTKKRPDSALSYASKMFVIANRIKSADDQIESLQKIIKLSPANLTKNYFGLYQRLDDSIQLARNKAKNQFALIRYETEKHKADSLKFQKENIEKTYVVITLVILLGAGIFWYRKRKQRLQMEAENAIKESQLKTSKKIHDVVANGLYRVMNKVEYQEEINKEHLLDEIEELYEKSRDISYEEPVALKSNFHQKIAALLNAFNNHKTQVVIHGNTATLWKNVGTTVQYEVEHILQELMVNMGKHSEASEVTLRFEAQPQEIHVFYEDNGIGIKGEVKSVSGLRNTETRIKNLNGQITFETKLEKGLKVHFSFPVS